MTAKSFEKIKLFPKKNTESPASYMAEHNGSLNITVHDFIFFLLQLPSSPRTRKQVPPVIPAQVLTYVL